MKYTFFVISILLLGNTSHSQNIKTEIINTEKLNNVGYPISNTSGVNFFIKNETKTKFVLTQNAANKIGENIIINKLDNEFNTIKTTNLYEGKMKFIHNFYSIFQFQKNNCIIYQELDESDNLSNVKLAIIDNDSINIKKEITAFDFRKNQIDINSKAILRSKTPNYTKHFSENKKMLLIVTETDTENGKKTKVFFTVIDENLNIISEQKIEMPSIYSSPRNYLCDDAGNVYINYYMRSESRKDKLKKGDIDDDPFYIMKIEPKSKNIKTLKYNLKGFSLSNHILQFSPLQKKILITGTYTEAWNDNYYQGVFDASINIDNFEISEVRKTEFPEDLVKKFETDGYGSTKPKKYGITGNVAPLSVTRGDGSNDFILYHSLHTTYDRGYDDFDEGYILDVHLLQDKIYFCRIPRDMRSPGTSSYVHFSTFSNNENLTFFYNDNAKNIKKNLEEKPQSGIVQKSDICAATVGKDGILKRENLTENLEGKNIGNVSKYIQFSNSGFYFFIDKLSFMNMSTSKFQLMKVIVN